MQKVYTLKVNTLYKVWGNYTDEHNAIYFEFLKYDNLTCFDNTYKPIKEKVYVVLADDDTNTLREVRPIKAYYGATNVREPDNNVLIYANVAGVGKVWLIGGGRYYYNSKEDFANDKATTIFENYNVNVGHLFDQFSKDVCKPSQYDAYITANRFRWVNNQVEKMRVHIVFTYDVATKTFGYICKEEVEGTYPYKSKDECIADNQVAVCEFEDTANTKKKVVCIDRIETRCYETNMSVGAIINEVRNSGIEGNYRVFVDGDCVIDNS